MANATIKITSLPNIGNALTTSAIFPIVANVNQTDKVTLGNVGNLILTEAGNTLEPAFVSQLAYSVTNAAQPNITSVGTLTSLEVSGNIEGNLNLSNIANLKIDGGTNGYVIQTDGSGNLTWTAQTGGGGGNGTPGGANTQVQFNDAGDFGGAAGFTFDKTTSVLTAPHISGESGNLSNIQGANVSGAVAYATTANSVAVANVTGIGNIATVNLTGSASTVLYGNGVFAAQTDSTGNIRFVGDAIYDLNGIILENADLTHGATAAVIIPSNGSNDPIQINNTYGNIAVQAGSNAYLQSTWTFNNEGTIVAPYPNANAFQLPLSPTYYVPTLAKPDLILTDTPWEFTAQYVYGTNGDVSLTLNTIFPALVNPGYETGDEFAFDSSVTGIAGYTLTCTLTNVVQSGPAGWTANPQFTQPFAYPSTLSSDGAVKISSNANNWVFGTTGVLTYPDNTTTNGASVTPSDGSGYAINTTQIVTQSAPCYISHGEEMVANSGAYPNIVAVQVGWTVVIGGNTFTVTFIDPAPPAEQYRITCAGATFVQGDLYTFVNPATVTHTWGYGSDGTTTLPTGVQFANTLSQLTLVSGAIEAINLIDNTTSGFLTNNKQFLLKANAQTWTFDDAGNVRAPGNFVVNNKQGFWAYSPTGLTVTSNVQSDVNGISMEDGVNTAMYAEANVVIETNVSTGSYSWTFDNTGNLTLPTNNFTVNYANGTQVSLGGGLPLANGTSNFDIPTINGNAIITVAGNAWTFSDTTIVSPSDIANGVPQLVITSDGVPTIVSDLGTGPGNLGIVSDYLNMSGYSGAKVAIHGDDGSITGDNNIVIKSNGTDSGNIKSWTFDNAGNLTFPNGTISNGNTVTTPTSSSGTVNPFVWKFNDLTIGSSTTQLEWNTLYTDQNSWYFSTDSRANYWAIDSSTQSMGFIGDGGVGFLGTVTFGNATNGGTGAVNDIELTAPTTGNVYLTAGTKTWTFDNTGNTYVAGNILVGGAPASPAPYINGFDSAQFANLVRANHVIMSNNAVYTTAGSDLLLNPQFGTATNGYIQIPTFADGGEKLTIKNDYASGNGIDVVTGGGTWFFGENGNLTVPGKIQGAASYNQPSFITPNGSDSNWSYGIYNDGGSNFWMQSQFFGQNQATRGFRVLESEGNTVVFSVNGNGDAVVSGDTTTNSITLKNSDDFAQVLFSNDGGATNNGQIKVDGGTNMVISSASNFYVKRAGSDRIAVTDTTSDFMASTNVTIQSNKAGVTNTWNFDSTGNLTIPSSSGGFIKTSTNASIGIAAIDNGTNNPAQMMSWNQSAGPTTIISTYATNALIQTNVAGTMNTWKFDNTGNLTLPTNTFAVKYANGTQVSVGGTPSGSNTYVQFNDNGSFGGSGGLVYDKTSGNLTVNGGFVNAAAVVTTGRIEAGTSISATGNATVANVVFSANSGQVAFNTTAYITGNVVGREGSIRLEPYTGAGSTFPGVMIGGAGRILAPNQSVHIILNTGDTTFQVPIKTTLTTAATSTTTGAITMGGGASFASGITTGVGALLTGPTFTPLANTVAGFNSNVNSYTQVTFQNKSTGTDATADFILTADNGNDSVNYSDFGIINSGYDNNTPTNSLGNIVFAADTYLYAQGNVSNTSQAGGNLAIGTTTVGKNIKLFAGGVDNTAIVANISNIGISTPNSPAFRVYGTSSTNIPAGTTVTTTQGATVDYNQGSYYNNTTGIFTAPIAGLYQAYATLRVGSVNSQMQASIQKNSSTAGANVIGFWESDTNTGTAAHFSMTGYAKCAVGDTIRLQVVTGNVQFDANDSWGVTFIG